jgi:phospholipid/cholesterol/gamma-HCH transport system substrate-binding protein
MILTGIVLLVWGINFLKGKDLFSKYKVFYAVYKNVDGLSKTSAVQISGLKVGQVDEMILIPGPESKVLVRMRIENETPVTHDSRALIKSQDLLGTKVIELVLGHEKTAESGDTLASDVEESISQMVNKQMVPIAAKAGKLMDSMDSVMMAVNSVFSRKTQQDLIKTFDHLQSTAASLNRISLKVDTLVSTEKKKIRKVMANIESISSMLQENNAKIANAIHNFSSISDTLAKARLGRTVVQTTQVMQDASLIMDKIRKGEGSAGMLINNDELYKGLNSSASELSSLIADLKDNPKRYINLSVISFGGGGKKKSSESKTKQDKSIKNP